MENVLEMNPYVAQLVLWFLGFAATAVFGTLACYIAGLAKREGSRI
ncbi:MAG TPA: hypothetical protein VGM51_17675 [Armatimonadota bacterium]|jgi:hypothetical protein